MESKAAWYLIHILFLPTSVFTFIRMTGIKFLGITKLPFESWQIWTLFIVSGLYAVGNVALLFIRVWNRYMDARERLLNIRAKDAALRRIGK